MSEREPSRSRSTGELAGLFLKLGVTAFGGPAAHIAMIEDEVVRRRKWLTREELLDLIGAANVIPGPTSTELAIHIGHRRGGWPGLLVAGVCFIVPAALIVLAIAWAYVRWGELPQVDAILRGVKPVVIAVVLQALVGLGRTAIKGWFLAAVGLLAALANVLGAHELAVLAGAGALVAALRAIRDGRTPRAAGWIAWPSGIVAASTAVAAPFGLGLLFLTFLKIGALLFGSGYVLLAFLRADLVDRLGWLGEAQLLDAVAVGQVTPGPVFTTATFIGYVLGGFPGAAVATVGIFLPAFVFVALSGPLLPRIRRSPIAGAALDGINVAALALMAVVTWQLGRAAIVDAPTAVLALASAALLLLLRVSSTWLVLGGALVGLLLLVLGVWR